MKLLSSALTSALLTSALLGASAPAHAETLAVKNYREIYASLSSLAGLGVDPDAHAYFESVKRRLPKDGSVQGLNATALSAVRDLGAYVCQRMLTREAATAPASRLPVHRDVDFTVPFAHLTVADVRGMIARYASYFLRADVPLTDPAIDAAAQTILADPGLAGGDATPAYKAACVSVVTSVLFVTK